MTRYVPADWPIGETATCGTCGNVAPDVPRAVVGEGRRECSLCFIGRVLNEVCSQMEARALRAELTHEIRTGALWKSKEVKS